MCPVRDEVWDHWGAMVLAAHPVVGTWDEAHDCASQAIVQYLEHDGREVANLEAFMVTVAKRRAIDHVRARERSRVRDERWARSSTLTAVDVAEDVARRAEATWADREARRLLQPRVYELLTLVADGVPVPEAAERLGMSRRSAESHLLRARRLVRAALASTLGTLGVAAGVLRRWWAPAAVSAPVLAAALTLAIGTAGAPPSGGAPVTTLLPGTTALPSTATADVAVPSTPASRRTSGHATAAERGTAARPGRPSVDVTTPVGGVSVEDRDNGHHSANVVEAWLWCLQHFRAEVGYVGCETEGSAQQGSGEPAGDRPLLPAVR